MQLTRNEKIITAAAVAAGVLAAVVLWPGKGKAEGVDQPSHASGRHASSEPWTGPSIGVGVGWAVGTVEGAGPPIGLESQGGKVDGIVGYDKQFGRLVAGVELGYGRYFGDLETLGVKADMWGSVRLGLLATPGALLYGHLGYGRLDTDAGGINGWRLGPGVEVKIAETPFSVDMRYTYGIHDINDLCHSCGIEARSHEFMAHLKFRPIWK